LIQPHQNQTLNVAFGVAEKEKKKLAVTSASFSPSATSYASFTVHSSRFLGLAIDPLIAVITHANGSRGVAF